MKMVEFPWTRMLLTMVVASLPFLPLALSIHEMPERATEMCLDTAGKPGYWDCDLGKRIDPPVWNVIGTGLVGVVLGER